MKKGLSPLVAAVLVIAVSVAGIAIVLQIGLPALNESEEFATLTEAKGVLLSIDNAIREVAAEGEGSTRRLSLRTTGGTYFIDNTSDEVRFEMETHSEIVPPCTGLKEGRIRINTGGDVTAEERDANNDGTTDLVLENSKVMFVVNKTGSPSNPASIDTRNLILKMRIKDADVNVTPTDSRVIVDGKSDSSTGTGYTKLMETGDNRGRGRIKAHIKSDANINYDIIYNLFCGDYIRVDIQNAEYR